MHVCMQKTWMRINNITRRQNDPYIHACMLMCTCAGMLCTYFVHPCICAAYTCIRVHKHTLALIHNPILHNACMWCGCHMHKKATIQESCHDCAVIQVYMRFCPVSRRRKCFFTHDVHLHTSTYTDIHNHHMCTSRYVASSHTRAAAHT